MSQVLVAQTNLAVLSMCSRFQCCQFCDNWYLFHHIGQLGLFIRPHNVDDGFEGHINSSGMLNLILTGFTTFDRFLPLLPDFYYLFRLFLGGMVKRIFPASICNPDFHIISLILSIYIISIVYKLYTVSIYTCILTVY